MNISSNDLLGGYVFFIKENYPNSLRGVGKLLAESTLPNGNMMIVVTELFIYGWDKEHYKGNEDIGRTIQINNVSILSYITKEEYENIISFKYSCPMIFDYLKL